MTFFSTIYLTNFMSQVYKNYILLKAVSHYYNLLINVEVYSFWQI